MSGDEGKRAHDKRNLVAIILGAVAAYIETEKQTPSVFPETRLQPQASQHKTPGESNRQQRN